MLELKNIVKNYVAGDTVVNALVDINLDFRKSEFVSILGQSGCGKTTLLNIIGGLDHYTSGDLIINNKSTKDFKDGDWDTYRNHSIGFVFQSYNLIMHLSVLENVELALSLAGISKEERKKRAIEALNTVGLSSQINKKPNQLSGGQMQRVAIARSLVNNPDILLADEPTGALDSETSEQVMKILKDISRDRLIIMVTHNRELAEKYSTRIITLLDGKVTSDSRPYNHKQNSKSQNLDESNSMLNKLTALLESDKISLSDFEKYKTQLQDNKELDVVNDKKLAKLLKNKKDSQKRTAMGYGTALALSFRNLLTKKWRTIMTSFAGSIGIIGIALILAVSNGFTNYINKMQSDALGNYPLTVSAISMDMNKFQNASMHGSANSNTTVEEQVVVPYNPMQRFIQFGHYNNLSKDFLNHVKQFETLDLEKGKNSQLNIVEYDYFAPIKILSKYNNNKVRLYINRNNTSILQGGSSSPIYPMLNNIDFVMSGYELIYGSMPSIKEGDTYSKEMLLVLDKGNKLSISTLDCLGITPTVNEQGDFNNISFEEICNKEFKLLFNDDYYTPNSEDFNSITSFSKLSSANQSELASAYDNANTTLKISGVIRIKDDAPTELLSAGIAYMPSLKEYYLENCKNSLIARKQLTRNIKDDFFDNYIINVAEMATLPAKGYLNVNEINEFLFQSYKFRLTDQEAFDLALQQIGVSPFPVAISFYPKNFEAKDAVLNMIESFNKKQTDSNLTIVCSDTTSFLTNTLGNLVGIISYVLIAFAAISLVVSSIMIAIITYVSVLERTKEIGVLRSIGARKKDITRVFNAETFLIGLTSGLIGVTISFVLTFPISAIVKAVAGGSITTSIAVMDPISSVILVAISVVLTIISGLIPAIMAANRDPVRALRSE